MGKIFRTSDIFLIPNLITIARLFLMIPLLISYYFDYMIYFYALLVITIISDFLDGILARHLNLSSNFGSYLDIVCDLASYSGIIVGFYFLSPDLAML